jgi:hypothetical protein
MPFAAFMQQRSKAMAKYGKKARSEVKKAIHKAWQAKERQRRQGQEPQAGHRDWALQGPEERRQSAAKEEILARMTPLVR